MGERRVHPHGWRGAQMPPVIRAGVAGWNGCALPFVLRGIQLPECAAGPAVTVEADARGETVSCHRVVARLICIPWVLSVGCYRSRHCCRACPAHWRGMMPGVMRLGMNCGRSWDQSPA